METVRPAIARRDFDARTVVVMGFGLRPHIAGAAYHVCTRATGPSEFFRDRDDRIRFLRILKYAIPKYGWHLHAYCLMVTHFHLVLTTPEPNISRGMQLLNSVYSRTFNKRHGRLGHLVAARYSATVIESEIQARNVCRYVYLNPVRSRLCAQPEQWPWSSYAATLGLHEEPWFVDSSWVLEQFGGGVTAAREALREFVDEGLVSETLQVA